MMKYVVLDLQSCAQKRMAVVWMKFFCFLFVELIISFLGIKLDLNK